MYSSCLVYSHIWLNISEDDRQLGYIEYKFIKTTLVGTT